MNVQKKGLAKTIYQAVMPWLSAYAPSVWATIAYYRHYGKLPRLRQPRTFSEKLLWLKAHTYQGNKLILSLSDKLEVRRYVEACGCGDLLNELYYAWDDPAAIAWPQLPQRFALKLSQGWDANLLCADKTRLDIKAARAEVDKWANKQRLYDINSARVGGICRSELRKHYICERYLGDCSGHTPSDYKIYCFHGEPLAILYISDRYADKTACWLRPDWSFLSFADQAYKQVDEPPPAPASLAKMIAAAAALSRPFPFVRVDFYDVDGQAIFGEMTFFPSGCIGMQQIEVDGKDMSELLAERTAIDYEYLKAIGYTEQTE